MFWVLTKVFTYAFDLDSSLWIRPKYLYTRTYEGVNDRLFSCWYIRNWVNQKVHPIAANSWLRDLLSRPVWGCQWAVAASDFNQAHLLHYLDRAFRQALSFFSYRNSNLQEMLLPSVYKKSRYSLYFITFKL